MIRTAWIGVLVACSSTPSQPKQPGTPTTPDALGKPDVHRYREAVVNATLAALTDGDVDTLAGLAAPGCEAAAKKELAAVATKAKGQKVEAVSIKLEATPVRYGEAKLTGCAPKGDAMVHTVTLKLRVADKRTERSDMKIVEVDHRFYVATVPDYVGAGGPKQNDLVATFRAFTDQMCACKDKACADKVQDDFTKWGTEMSKKMDRDERPDDETMKQLTDMMSRYADCMTKVMGGMP
jgi:hypothetical protein